MGINPLDGHDSDNNHDEENLNNEEVLPKQPKKLNLEDFRIEAETQVFDLWDYDLSYAQNFANIYKKTVAIPDRSIQLPILQCYASIPSTLSHYAPILFLHGREGTGKSLTAMLFVKIHKVKLLAKNTTFAAARNELKRTRWEDSERERMEKNCCLVFDNINASTLKSVGNDQLFSFFLSGYCRASDNMPISKGDGSNIDFRVFSPKVITSVHPLYSDPTLAELGRRMITLKFRHLKKIDPIDLVDFDPDEMVEPEITDLSCLSDAYWSMWNEEYNCRAFAEFRKELKRQKNFPIASNIETDKWRMCIEMIAAGFVAGAFNSLEEGVEALSNYWQWHHDNVATQVGALQKAIRDYIANEESYVQRIKQEAKINIPLEVNCDKFYSHILTLSRAGIFETRISPELITNAMNLMNFHQTNVTSSGNWCWVRDD
jgi:hypothetical protein